MDISPELRAAYESTRFVAHGPGGDLDILIGRNLPELDRLLTEEGATEWAYISAWNPRSEPTPAEVNSATQIELEAELSTAGYRFFPGEGVPADSAWPPEASVLVLGINRAAAIAVGRRYGQNAIVVGAKGQAAELLFLAASGRVDASQGE